MAKYKADLGTYARTSALWLLGGLWVFGCNEFFYFLGSFRGDPEAAEPGGLAARLLEDNLPVLGLPLTWALVIAVVVGIAGLVVLMKFLDRPKVADLLIDSETEMRKCTWPSWHETFTSSIVILVVMLIFTVLLAGMDWVLNEIVAKNILS